MTGAWREREPKECAARLPTTEGGRPPVHSLGCSYLRPPMTPSLPAPTSKEARRLVAEQREGPNDEDVCSELKEGMRMSLF